MAGEVGDRISTEQRRAGHEDGGAPGSFSRDLAAAGRDRAAEERDRAARARDERAGDAPLSPAERRLAARDREASARDRRAAAADRRAAYRELADEGIDELTGVMRRGVGLAAIRREIARTEREGAHLIVAFVDTVGLKRINDTRGHAAGDQVLREVAESISGDLRPYDIVTRVGGDEFVCALSGETTDTAARRYERISDHLAARGNGAAITVGLASHRPGDTLESLVERADAAMLARRRRPHLRDD
jgi:diguanylate cyclase (GGDEF)-like protein